MAQFVIQLQDLEQGAKEYTFALEADWLDSVMKDTGVKGDAKHGAGTVQVHASMTGREVLVYGKASATLVTECGRCLGGLPYAVEAEVTSLFVPKADESKHKRDAEEDEIDPNEPDLDFYVGDELELDGLVRDYLLLELPMQPSCDKGWDCPNLDLPDDVRASMKTDIHADAGLDPRLAPLQKLAEVGKQDKE